MKTSFKRKSNSYDTSRVSYCWRRFSKLDEFTRITIYFAAACLALTAALIIDAAVGYGPVQVKFSVKTSHPFCDKIVEEFIKSSRNSHNAAVLGKFLSIKLVFSRSYSQWKIFSLFSLRQPLPAWKDARPNLCLRWWSSRGVKTWRRRTSGVPRLLRPASLSRSQSGSRQRGK